jgi:glycosyltransferase involved in cell wall biosynthesis
VNGSEEAEPRGRALTIVAVGAGSSTHVARFVQRFAKKGHRVVLFTDSPNPSGIEDVEQLVPPVRRWIPRVPRPLRGALYHGLSALDLLRALRAFRPDVVHVYYAYSYFAWVAGLLGCRPLVVSVMGGDILFAEQGAPGPVGRWLTVLLLRRADYITSQSHFLSGVVERLGGSSAKTERILWGVPPEEFGPRDVAGLRPALGLDQGARIILSPKILQPFYRVHLVIEAMAIVRRSVPKAMLVVSEYAADPAYREQIARRVEELGVTQHVMFVGQIPYEEMPSYYSLAEVSVGIPSSDSMPQALFEAMACGTPTILSRLPRYEEIVQHEESAYFVDPDPEAIAAGIVHLLEDTGLRNRIAEQGRRIVVEQADLDKETERVETRYRELLADIRPRAFSLAALLSAGFAAARTYLGGRPKR